MTDQLGGTDTTSPLTRDSSILGASSAAEQKEEEDATPDEETVERSRQGASNSSSIRVVNSFKSARRLGAPPPEHEDAVDGEEKRPGCGTRFCKLMDDWPITFVVAGAAIGIAVGIGLAFWTPEDPSTKDAVILWIGLLGDLFIRSLKCIVLPLVFVSIAVSVMDMLSLGKAGKVVGLTIGLYVCTTIAAALFGVLCSVIFSRFYALETDVVEEIEVPADVRLGCSVDPHKGTIESFLAEMSDGSVMCMDKASVDLNDNALFRMEDVNGYFETSYGQTAQLSLSESIYQGLFLQLIDDNMVGMFVNANFLGVIVLGAGFGVALNQLMKKMPPGVNWNRILSVQVLEELMEVFMFFIFWIIRCTPFAVISLIAKAIGSQEDIVQVLEQLAYLVAAVCVGLAMQFVIVYLGLFILFVRSNPFSYLKHMVPAQTMGFASASSAATIPVSIDCATSTGIVPDGVARFTIPLGATINMDGGAIYIICASVYLAYQNGIVPTVTDYILLVICATLGSMGTAPVPSAVIVLTLTSYTTTFGAPLGGGEPEGLGYLFAVDWLLDRFRTVTNLTGDLVVTGIVASKVSEDQADMLGSLADAEDEGGKGKEMLEHS